MRTNHAFELACIALVLGCGSSTSSTTPNQNKDSAVGLFDAKGADGGGSIDLSTGDLATGVRSEAALPSDTSVTNLKDASGPDVVSVATDWTTGSHVPQQVGDALLSARCPEHAGTSSSSGRCAINDRRQHGALFHQHSGPQHGTHDLLDRETGHQGPHSQPNL